MIVRNERLRVESKQIYGSTSTSAQDSSGDITGSGSAAPTVAESINVPVGSSTWEESASTAKFEDDDAGARDSQNRIAYYENRIAELERCCKNVPHMLKLTRNNLLDHGIHTPMGFVNKSPLIELVRYQSGDFKMAYKISATHLQVKGCDRQKVKTAAQLLSASVGRKQTLVFLQPNTFLMGDDKCIAVGLKEFRANSSPIKENISPSQVLPADPCLSAELCKTLEYCDTHSEDTIENFHVPDNESEGFH
ncbi:hypothetical protein Pcinc_010629 [Petrolisthes cinctipes]|uniref:Transposable element P transposase-like GTP-binding insertion domain-containing protein n=1 Tax=Petrolisthes cinctipes TaxID=88211 RepID=A0AAE1G2D8_PETCI|nr:hypothetical protein Pcinc_010629 [Petrolisthes cinctipes]